MPYVRKTKRSPSVSKRLKIVALACTALAVALVLGALVSMHQERVARGAAEAANFTPAPLPDDTVSVAVIGDSYTGGSNEGGMSGDAWTDLLDARIEDASFSVAAYGGSGYINVGPTEKVFRDGVERVVNSGTELVVIFGSVNDVRQDAEAVSTEASNVFSRVKEVAPDAELLVIGPASATGNPDAEATARSQAILTAAQEAGATTLDPYAAGWFAGKPELIGADAVHPTSEGHEYMANLIEPAITALLP